MLPDRAATPSDRSVEPDRRRAIVLADGAVPDRSTLDAAWPGWAADVDIVIAADGGARNARALGLHVGHWVGDGDSIDAGELAALEASGVPIERLPTAKDASDTEVALLVAARRAHEIVLLGALGRERLDHGLANLGLLQHPALEASRLELYDEHGARIRLLGADNEPATATLDGRIGDLVSLLPVGQTADGVTTEGLGYPLLDEPLVLGSSRGLSNVKTGERARVTLRNGRLLVIETPVTVRP
jgi:thiamine pyrophosphokinase